MPAAFWIARVCDEFHCLPSDAEREARRQPVGWLDEIIEARHYAECHHIWTRARSKQDVPDSPLMACVKEIEFELVNEAREAAKDDG